MRFHVKLVWALGAFPTDHSRAVNLCVCVVSCVGFWGLYLFLISPFGALEERCFVIQIVAFSG